MLARIRPPDVEACRVGEHLRIPVRRTQQHRHAGAGGDGVPGQPHVGARGPPGDLHGAVQPQHLLDRVGPARGIGAEGVPLVAMGVEEHDGVAEQVDRRLETGAEQQHHGRVQLALGQRLVLGQGHQPADEIVAGLAPQPFEVPPQEGVHGAQRPLGRDVAPERESRVQSGGRGLAPVQELLAAFAGHAEQVGDDQDRELGGVGGHQVDRAAGRVERVEQFVGGPPDHRLGRGGRPRGECAADQAPEPRVVGWVDDQHRRRLGDPGRVELVPELQRPADPARRQRPVPAHAEGLRPEHLLGDGVRRRHQSEAAGDQRPLRPQLFVHVVGVLAHRRVAEQPGDQLAAPGTPVQERRREGMSHAPADDRPRRP